jgi:adenine specific DNA methylase Mod
VRPTDSDFMGEYRQILSTKHDKMPPDLMADNTLYFGDNLKILRDNIRDETVDLIYLDPPFNSKANYNVLFRSTKGHESHAQITAFEDTWHWGEQAEAEFTVADSVCLN